MTPQRRQEQILRRQIEEWVVEMMPLVPIEEWGERLADLLVDWANNYGVIFTAESLHALQHWMAHEQDLAIRERELAEGRAELKAEIARLNEDARAAAVAQGFDGYETIHFRKDPQTGEFTFTPLDDAPKEQPAFDKDLFNLAADWSIQLSTRSSWRDAGREFAVCVYVLEVDPTGWVDGTPANLTGIPALPEVTYWWNDDWYDVLNPWAESARLGDWWGTAFSLPLESQIEWNQARQRAVILRTPKEFLEGADPRDLRKYQRLGAAGEKACHVVLEMPGKMAETLWFAGENAMLAAGGARVVAGGARLAAGSGRAIIGGAGRGLASRGLPRLHWHGSRPAVERAYAQGLFAHGPGSGGKYWATTLSARGKLTDLLIGGTQNVDSLIPLRLSSKGAFEAVYALTPQEAAQFSRAWGFTYSWNPYQWYKGSLFGQYYYQAVPVTWGQRGTELGRATIITGAVAGGTVGADYLIQQK